MTALDNLVLALRNCSKDAKKRRQLHQTVNLAWIITQRSYNYKIIDYHSINIVSSNSDIKLHKKVIKFSSSKNCSWISLTDTWQHFHLHVYCLHDCAVRVHVHVYIATYLLTARIVVCQTEACCRGFYGAECYACPGGFKTPCTEHGQVWIIREYRSFHSFCLHTSRWRLKYCLVCLDRRRVLMSFES